MKLFPSKKYSLKTSLNADEVLQKLRSNLKPWAFIRFKFYLNDPEDCYEGKIIGNVFWFNRIDINKRRDILLQSGVILTKNNYTEILITIKYKKSHLLFGYIFTGIFGLFFLTVIIFLIVKEGFTSSLLIPLPILMVLMIFLVDSSLDIETDRAIKFLSTVLEVYSAELLV